MRKVAWAFLTSLIAGTAVAAPVNWVASGWIVAAYNDSDSLPLSPQPGEAFTYSVVFDDAAPDTDSRDYIAKYTSAIQSATFSIGDQSYDLPLAEGSRVEVVADENYWHVMFRNQSAPEIPYPNFQPWLWSTLAIWIDGSPLAPSTTTLPPVPPADLSIYNTYFYLSEMTLPEHAQLGTYASVTGWVSGIEVRPVPEPATLAVLGAGLIGVAFARRRRN
jgi:hypothetical protein